jgi:hypothetical protein
MVTISASSPMTAGSKVSPAGKKKNARWLTFP